MENLQRHDSREEPLNDSWVELYFQHLKEAASESSKSGSPGHSGTVTPAGSPSGVHGAGALSHPVSLHSAAGQMEKLLAEAAREYSRSNSSRSSSRNPSTVASSRASPKSPHSPNNETVDGIVTIQEGQVLEQIKASDWIWDWSSRPEAHPPSDFNGTKFQHPQCRTGAALSVRNTKVMKSGPFSLENLPKLLLTHAATFLLGAALMFAYLKKYCKWSSPVGRFSAPTHTFNFN